VYQGTVGPFRGRFDYYDRKLAHVLLGYRYRL
jgi:hypothetical protein